MTTPYPKEFIEHQITVRDTTINYATIGHGPALLCIHGWSSNWYGWIPLAQILQKHYTLYLPDLPGYGRSGKLPSYSVNQQATYLAAFCKALAIKPHTIIAASMGTFIGAVLFQKQLSETPYLILLGAVVKSPRTQSVHSLTGIGLRLIQDVPFVESLPKRFLSTTWGAHFIAHYLLNYRGDRTQFDRYNLPGKRMMTPQGYVDMGVSVSKIHIPTVLKNNDRTVLFATGSRDIISKEQEIKAAFPHHSNIHFACVPNTGHIIALESPFLTAQYIQDFLKPKK